MNGSEPQSLNAITAIKVMGITIMVVIMGLGFILQNATNRSLSEQLSTREKDLATIENKIRIKRAQVATLKSPKIIRKKLEEFKISMQEIRSDQVIRLYEKNPVATLTLAIQPMTPLVKVEGKP